MALNNYRLPVGKSGLETLLRSMIEDIRRLKVCESSTIRVEQTTRGQVLTVRDVAGASTAVSVARFRIKTLGNDYFIGNRQNADGSYTESDETQIAKPHTLRLSSYSGATLGDWFYPTANASASARRAIYSGSAVPGGLAPGDYQDEELWPPYIAGETEIVAAQCEGETGVVNSDDIRINWVDLNVGAKRFRAIRSLVNVCVIVNGVQTQKRFIADGGPAF